MRRKDSFLQGMGKRMRQRVRKMFRDTRGNVLVMAAFALPVMLGAGALSVDLGHAFLAKSVLQNASDAGARAGAAVLGDGGTQAAAQAAAVNFANQNVAPNNYLAGATPTVTFPTAGSVQVRYNFNLGLFFAPVLGIQTVPVAANATAGIAFTSSIPPNTMVPLAIACNNPAGCAGVLSVGQTWTMRRYCGNFFMDGPSGNACGTSIAGGEAFITGFTLDDNNSTEDFRTMVREGYAGEMNLGQVARALPGDRNGWRDGMTDRLANGENEFTMAVVRGRNPAASGYNIEIVDFVRVRATNFSINGKSDTTTFEIIQTSVSTNNFSDQPLGYSINSVVGVRLIN